MRIASNVFMEASIDWSEMALGADRGASIAPFGMAPGAARGQTEEDKPKRTSIAPFGMAPGAARGQTEEDKPKARLRLYRNERVEAKLDGPPTHPVALPRNKC